MNPTHDRRSSTLATIPETDTNRSSTELEDIRESVPANPFSLVGNSHQNRYLNSSHTHSPFPYLLPGRYLSSNSVVNNYLNGQTRMYEFEPETIEGEVPDSEEMAIEEEPPHNRDVIHFEEEVIYSDASERQSELPSDSQESVAPSVVADSANESTDESYQAVEEIVFETPKEIPPEDAEAADEESKDLESELPLQSDTETAAIKKEAITNEGAATEPTSKGDIEASDLDVDDLSDETLIVKKDEYSVIGGQTSERTTNLSTWRSEVSGAAREIPPPDLGDASNSSIEIRQGGTTLRQAREPVRRRIPREARNAVSDPPQVEIPPPPLQPSPVPEATRLVQIKSDRRLPEQSMPDLQISPRGTQPRVGDRPLRDEGPGSVTAANGAGIRTLRRFEAREPSAEQSPEQEQAEQLRQQNQTLGPETEHQGNGEGVTLTDEPLPPRSPLPRAAKSVITSVLARLLANPQEGAEHILVDARKAAYPNEELNNLYPNIGNEQLAGLTESVSSELHTVAQEAGIARNELDAAISERTQQLEAERQQAQGEVNTTAGEEREALTKAGQEENDLVAGAREAVDLHTEQQMETASGEADPAVVHAKRDRLQRNIDRTVGQQRAAYTQAKERRNSQVDRAARDQRLAYAAAAQRDERAILAAHRAEAQSPEPVPLEVQLQMTAARGWGTARERELRRTVYQMKQQANVWAEDYRSEVRSAGEQARALIQAWADERLVTEQSWWQRLFARIRGWFTQAQAESEVWETARAGETRDAILGDFVMLNQFAAQAGDNIDINSSEALNGLSEEQRAVVRAYYSNGPDARNPIAAVAAGLQVRLSLQRRPQLIERFNTELAKKPDAEWPNLDLLGKAQSASFNADAIRKNLYQAMHGGVTGWGTDEERVFRALASLTPIQATAVRKCYRDTHGIDLDEDIRDELSSAELTRAEALLAGDQTLADVATLREAMHGGITGLGTEEDVIWSVLRNKSEEERQRIIEEYRRQYDIDLSEELEDELSDHDLERAEALVEGDTARADAIAIDQAMRGGWTGWGTDESDIEAVYVQVRQDVVAYGARQNPPWTTAQVEAEVQRRNLSVEGSYNARYGGDWEQGDESALRQAYASELSGPELDLVDALADNDLIRADAARIAAEAQAIFVTDDDVVNGVLRNQYERALEEIRRDEWPAIQQRLDEQARQEGWTPYQRRAEERRLERELEQRAQERASGYMGQLEDRYNADYPTWYGGGLRTVVELNMSGNDREMARNLIAQGGYLSPAQEIHYAVEGAGTEEEAIRRALTGRSEEEIAAIRAEWERLHPGESMDERLRSELGGRDEFDTHMLLQGEPENAEQELVQMRERGDWELENSSGFLAGEQERILRDRMSHMEEQYRVLNDPEADPAQRQLAMRRFKQSTGNVSTAVEGYREQMDAATDVLATAAAITAAIVVVVVAAILTPFTGGGSAAAGAGILAALGGALTSGTVAAAAAVAAATATIVTKQLMLGDAYSGEDMAIDMVVGVVDAAAAYATAGIGAGLLKAARGGNLARMAASSSRMTRMAAHGLAEGAEGLIGSLPAAVTGNMLNDQNWEHGNPLTNIMTGVAMEAGIGTVVSAGIGGISGIRQAPSPDVRPQGDLLAHRGTPRERLDQWRAYKAEHPDADMRSWLREFDEGVAQRLAHGDAADQLQRRLRGELLSGIPPAQRRQFADATVEVVSDADFTRLTRSQRGQAVILIEGGKPRVLLREGADPRVLREEGIHLLQSIDPHTRKAVRQLDERRLADWDNLDIGEQFKLYRNKLELEIDAQQRLLRGFQEELAGIGDDISARRFLRQQMENVEWDLNNLTRRLDTVDSIHKQDRIRMSRGELGRPQYLDQPARLFSKGRPLRADPHAPRIPINNSPLNKKLLPGERIHQLGRTWKGANGRTYRQIEVLNPDGTVNRVREEILMPGGNWRQRGREATRSGEVAEEASLKLTEARAARAAQRGQKTIVTLGEKSQRGSGKGFDEVFFEFDSTGRAHIVIVEVKNYSGRYVPTSEFSAVVDNIADNMGELQKRISDEINLPAKKRTLGLNDAQLQAIEDAFDNQLVSLEIRLAPGTRLGTFTSGDVIANIKQAWKDAGLRPRVPVRTTPISSALMDEARVHIIRRDRIGTVPRFFQIADAAEGRGIMQGPFRQGPEDVFFDANGKPLTIHAVASNDFSERGADAIAAEVLDSLNQSIPLPGSTSQQALLSVLLDVKELSETDRTELQQAILDTVRLTKTQSVILNRLHSMI